MTEHVVDIMKTLINDPEYQRETVLRIKNLLGDSKWRELLGPFVCRQWERQVRSYEAGRQSINRKERRNAFNR